MAWESGCLMVRREFSSQAIHAQLYHARWNKGNRNIDGVAPAMLIPAFAAERSAGARPAALDSICPPNILPGNEDQSVKLRLLVLAVVANMAVDIVCDPKTEPELRSVIITNDNFSVPAGGQKVFPVLITAGMLKIPDKPASLTGHFSVSPPPAYPDNKLNFYVLDQYNYDRWAAGQPYSVVESDSMTDYVPLDTRLPFADSYYLVFDNRYDAYNAKNVKPQMKFQYWE
jgi:hypothetical protein